jgi:hypothetical protein
MCVKMNDSWQTTLLKSLYQDKKSIFKDEQQSWGKKWIVTSGARLSLPKMFYLLCEFWRIKSVFEEFM